MTKNRLDDEWWSMADAIGWLESHVGPDFVTANWDCKYIDARIDMRTGAMLLRPGNVSVPAPSSDALNARYDPMSRDELIAECERLRVELEHRERYWAQFDHVPKGASEPKAAQRQTRYCDYDLCPAAIAVVFAQVYPFHLQSLMRQLKPALPNIKERAHLEFVRDALRLAHSTGCFYRNFTLFRVAMADALEDIEETIDSLDFVLSSFKELNEFLQSAEKRSAPELPSRSIRPTATMITENRGAES